MKFHVLYTGISQAH